MTPRLLKGAVMLKKATGLALAILLLGVSVSDAGGRAEAQPAAKKATPTDPGFRAFFHAKDVGDAMTALDAKRLTDCALLLAHGERVLLRAHAHLSSKKLLSLALKLAVETADQAALARLDKALRPGASADMIVTLDAAILLGKQKRKGDPFAAESATPESQVLYKSMADQIKLAANLNDRESLENLRKTIPTLTELTAQQRKHLHSHADEALRATAKTAEPEDDYLAQLARASRGSQVAPPMRK